MPAGGGVPALLLRRAPRPPVRCVASQPTLRRKSGQYPSAERRESRSDGSAEVHRNPFDQVGWVTAEPAEQLVVRVLEEGVWFSQRIIEDRRKNPHGEEAEVSGLLCNFGGNDAGRESHVRVHGMGMDRNCSSSSALSARVAGQSSRRRRKPCVHGATPMCIHIGCGIMQFYSPRGFRVWPYAVRVHVHSQRVRRRVHRTARQSHEGVGLLWLHSSIIGRSCCCDGTSRRSYHSERPCGCPLRLFPLLRAASSKVAQAHGALLSYDAMVFAQYAFPL
jgi:hypothetical protein